MQLWSGQSSEAPLGTFAYQALDSDYFIRAGMSIQKEFSFIMNINLNNGDGIFAAANVGVYGAHAEVLIQLECAPVISFNGGYVRLDSGGRRLAMDVYWKVRLLFSCIHN